MGAFAKFLLVVLAVALLAWWLFGGRARRVDRNRQRDLPAPEGMLRCAHCGVHLPRSEAVLLGAEAYCSVAHRDAGPHDVHD